jgi:rhodanese-related sulfurtransferase
MEPIAQPLHLRRFDATPRAVAPAEVNPDALLIFDVRREADFNASGEIIPGALWKNPERIDAWIGAVPLTLDLVVYCEHGDALSRQVVDQLRRIGAKARYIEGGLDAWKAAGGRLARK